MRKIIALLLFVLASSAVAMAAPPPFSIPEIDPASGATALALISGGLLILRSYRRK